MKTTIRTFWKSLLIVFLGALLAGQAHGQTQFNLRTVPLPSNAWGAVTVNEALNKIYTSGNPSNNFDLGVTVIDGVTFTTKDAGYGTDDCFTPTSTTTGQGTR